MLFFLYLHRLPKFAVEVVQVKKGRKLEMKASQSKRVMNSGRTRKLGIRGKKRNLVMMNSILSSRVDKRRIREIQPVLEVQNSVVINLDYNNPQQMKWSED
jgi:hypothetical protein